MENKYSQRHYVGGSGGSNYPLVANSSSGDGEMRLPGGNPPSSFAVDSPSKKPRRGLLRKLLNRKANTIDTGCNSRTRDYSSLPRFHYRTRSEQRNRTGTSEAGGEAVGGLNRWISKSDHDLSNSPAIEVKRATSELSIEATRSGQSPSISPRCEHHPAHKPASPQSPPQILAAAELEIESQLYHRHHESTSPSSLSPLCGVMSSSTAENFQKKRAMFFGQQQPQQQQGSESTISTSSFKPTTAPATPKEPKEPAEAAGPPLRDITNATSTASAQPQSKSMLPTAHHKELITAHKDKVPAYVPAKLPAPVVPKPPPQVLQLNGFVGFDSLPYQLVGKCKAQGFQFNLLCVGETGTGKTTLLESLFNTPMDFEPCGHELSTVELKEKVMDLSEGDVRVKLRVVETAGFGDQLGKDKSVKVIVDYLGAQFESYLREELKPRRQLAYYDDTRVHACLYLISPTGHGLKAVDVLTMKALTQRANVIPVIAKADTVSKEELVRFKQKILNELRTHQIDLYQFPTDDEVVRQQNLALNHLMPFAVVGSTDFFMRDGRKVRARRYPWGVVEVENEEHCDFVKLREALLRVNLDALHERTHKILYERYRRERLRQMELGDGDSMAEGKIEAYLKRQRDLKAQSISRGEVWDREFTLRVGRKEADMHRETETLDARERRVRTDFAKEIAKLENLLNEKKAKLAEEKRKADKRR